MEDSQQHQSFKQRALEKRSLRRILMLVISKPTESILGLVLVVLATGILFYHVVEDWSFLDSAYFSVITLTTIGFGDFSPKTDLGKIFTIFYAFAGIGLLAGYIQLRARQRIQRRQFPAKDPKAGAWDGDVLPHEPLP